MFWTNRQAAVTAGMAKEKNKEVANSIGQNVGDSLYKGITGQEKRRNISDKTSLKYGQDFVDGQGKTKKADFGDITAHAEQYGEKVGQERANRQIENYKKRTLPPDNQDSFLNK